MAYFGRRNAKHDPYFIPNPDPTRHYRWLSDSPARLALWLRGVGDVPGYTLVSGEKAAELGLPKDYTNDPAGRIRYGFNVLASIPIEEYEIRVRELVDEQLEKLSATKDAYFAASERVPGVKPFEREIGEIEDRKKFATRESNSRTFVSSRNRPAPGA